MISSLLIIIGTIIMLMLGIFFLVLCIKLGFLCHKALEIYIVKNSREDEPHRISGRVKAN
ncbi:MAG: hypothetical protein FNP40_11720 [Dehalobacter sp. 4CP]|uniref:hypothetical protein n=1 Tax=Dehalobacter sp. CP TaxID=2594474 RepID=UPI0013C8D5D5|nr:hypothetical protein [Dehalobacter sp. 4CP]